MRTALIALLFLAMPLAANATNAASAASAASAANADEDPNYAYAMSFSDGMRLTRYAKPEFAESLRPDRPECVMLNWSLDAQEQSLSVKNEEVERINAALTNAIKANDSAALVITTIGRTRGLWVFYAATGKSLALALEEQLKGKTKVPVVVRVVVDPKWNGFRNYLTKLSEPE